MAGGGQSPPGAAGLKSIGCTGCRYCVDGCPKAISIPELFACANSGNLFQDPGAATYYNICTRGGHGKAKDCIGCGKCARTCEFGAVTVENGVAKVDPTKCTACGKCVEACPRHGITMVES